MNSYEVNPSNINLQTWSCQYDKPSTSLAADSKTKVFVEPLTTKNGHLEIPQTKLEAIPNIPKGPLYRNVASNKSSHTYSIVDDLVQSPAAISTLQVLQSCHSQKKDLLTALGAVDPSNDCLIVYIRAPPITFICCFPDTS